MSVTTIRTEPDGTRYRLKCPDCESTEVIDGYVCNNCGREIHGGWDLEQVEAKK